MSEPPLSWRAAVLVGISATLVACGSVSTPGSSTPSTSASAATFLLAPVSALTHKQLAAEADAMNRRMHAFGIDGHAEVGGSSVSVAVPRSQQAAAEALLEPAGKVTFRPVLATATTHDAHSAPGSGGSFPTLGQAEAAFANFHCRNAAMVDRANAYLVTCNRTESMKYLLAPARVTGADLEEVSASLPATSLGTWQINLGFKRGSPTDEWARETAALTRLPEIPNCQPPGGCNALAITYDGVVQSAPRIVEPIYGGQAQITGNFTKAQAQRLAAIIGDPLLTSYRTANPR